MLRVSHRARRVLPLIGVVALLNTGIALAAPPAGDPGTGRSFFERLSGTIVHILDDYRVIWPQG